MPNESNNSRTSVDINVGSPVLALLCTVSRPVVVAHLLSTGRRDSAFSFVRTVAEMVCVETAQQSSFDAIHETNCDLSPHALVRRGRARGTF